MQLSQDGLRMLLARNVVEVRFRRRGFKPNWPMYRRMICTNDFKLLTSDFGRQVLHFSPPSGSADYNWISKKLVCTWDIFWQEFRMISVESHDVVMVFPTTPFDKFKEYFFQFLYPLSGLEKIDIMKK